MCWARHKTGTHSLTHYAHSTHSLDFWLVGMRQQNFSVSGSDTKFLLPNTGGVALVRELSCPLPALQHVMWKSFVELLTLDPKLL